MSFDHLLRLEPHGPDVFVGTGPSYPWGGLYGGQIVSQALWAAAETVDDHFVAHSLRAYFIRAGDSAEPARYEVDRIRNGRTFCTRRVVARQAVGAILNLETSFHTGEESLSVQTIDMEPGIPTPDQLVEDSWSPYFERRLVPATGAKGLTQTWFKMTQPLADNPINHAAALAYISDDLPTDAVSRAMGLGRAEYEDGYFSVSLDHTLWFHQPMRLDTWHLQQFTCHGFHDGRGLAIGHVFTPEGAHTATIAQEVLVRARRK